MDNIPRTPEAYRQWWNEQRPEIPYGFCWCGCGERTAISRHSCKRAIRITGEPLRFVKYHHNRARRDDVVPPNPGGLCACGCGEQTELARWTNAEKGWVIGERKLFVHGHNGRLSGREYAEEDRGYDTPCWIWQRAKSRDGYGQVTIETAGRKTCLKAHRIYFERRFGPIAPGEQLHHLCRVASCVNPEHMEALTQAEHSRRHFG